MKPPRTFESRDRSAETAEMARYYCAYEYHGQKCGEYDNGRSSFCSFHYTLKKPAIMAKRKQERDDAAAVIKKEKKRQKKSAAAKCKRIKCTNARAPRSDMNQALMDYCWTHEFERIERKNAMQRRLDLAEASLKFKPDRSAPIVRPITESERLRVQHEFTANPTRTLETDLKLGTRFNPMWRDDQ